jgi:DNA topoisomerase-2
VIETVKKKNKDAQIKLHQVKNHMWVFIKCLIENPSFDSQTKEYMTLRVSAFGSKCELSDDFIKKSKYNDGCLMMILILFTSFKIWCGGKYS